MIRDCRGLGQELGRGEQELPVNVTECAIKAHKRGLRLLITPGESPADQGQFVQTGSVKSIPELVHPPTVNSTVILVLRVSDEIEISNQNPWPSHGVVDVN